MPNWCHNELFIYGMPEEVADLVVFVKSESTDVVLSFNNIIPVPEKFRDNYELDEGYNWRIENWGTKWPVGSDSEITSRTLDSVCYSFESANSPALPIVEALHNKYPDLTFIYKYAEPGMDFAGECINGELKEGKIEDFDWAKDWYPDIYYAG